MAITSLSRASLVYLAHIHPLAFSQPCNHNAIISKGAGICRGKMTLGVGLSMRGVGLDHRGDNGELDDLVFSFRFRLQVNAAGRMGKTSSLDAVIEAGGRLGTTVGQSPVIGRGD